MAKILVKTIGNMALVFVLTFFSFSGCFSSWTGEEDGEKGTITVNLGGLPGLGRATMGAVAHFIILDNEISGPEPERGPYALGQQVSIPVDPGRWSVTIIARLNGIDYAQGSSNGFVQVAARVNSPVTITMDVDLYGYINGAMDLGDNPIPLPLAFVLDGSKWADILNTLQVLDNYRVNLDLSLCRRSDEISGSGLLSDGVFDPRGGNFIGKGKITSLILPNAAEIIPDGTSSQPTFRDFSSLVSLITGDELTSIGNFAFYGNTLTSVSFLGDMVETIGSYAFYDNNLEEIVIPSGVTIGEYAFSKNESMTRVEIGANCIIEGFAFKDYPLLETITIGAGVVFESETNPGYDSFDNGFDSFYIFGDRQAGIYTWNGLAWNHEALP